MFGLKRQLRKLQKRTAPKPEFKRDLWATLEHEYEDAYGPLPSARPVRLMYRLATVGVAVVVIFVATGTGVYAYNSPGVSDGHVLYPIKQGIEQVECGVLRDPERRATCHARMMQRRLDEAEVVTDSDRKERILEHAADELGVSVNEIKRDWVNPEDRSVLIEE